MKKNLKIMSIILISLIVFNKIALIVTLLILSVMNVKNSMDLYQHLELIMVIAMEVNVLFLIVLNANLIIYIVQFVNSDLNCIKRMINTIKLVEKRVMLDIMEL